MIRRSPRIWATTCGQPGTPSVRVLVSMCCPTSAGPPTRIAISMRRLAARGPRKRGRSLHKSLAERGLRKQRRSRHEPTANRFHNPSPDASGASSWRFNPATWSRWACIWASSCHCCREQFRVLLRTDRERGRPMGDHGLEERGGKPEASRYCVGRVLHTSPCCRLLWLNSWKMLSPTAGRLVRARAVEEEGAPWKASGTRGGQGVNR